MDEGQEKEVLNEESESSTDNENQDQNDAKEEAADAAEDSSDSENNDAKEESKKDLLAVVKDAVAETEPGDSSVSEDGGEDKEQKSKEDEAKGEEDKKSEAKAEEDKDLPFHDHPRWKEVIAERDSLKASANIGEQVTNFIKTSQLEPDEFNQLLEVGAMAKHDPEKAIPFVRDYLEKLMLTTGQAVPEDLQKQVEEGYMTEEAAKKFSKLQAENNALAERNRNTEAQQASQKVESLKGQIAASVETWEEERKRTDPDYAKKEELVGDFIRAEVQRRGAIKSTDEALEIANAAYSKTNDLMKATLPEKQSKKRVPTKPVKKQPSSAPANLREAIEAAAEGSYVSPK